MISVEKITTLINEKIEDSDLFIVDVSVSSSNAINVLVDAFNGLGINECVDLSRHIENNLDREEADFELQVSSPGLDMPFKVMEQYEKNVGREVSVITFDGKKHEGELVAVDGEKIQIKYTEKVRIEGKKKKEVVEKIEDYYFESAEQATKIKETKIIISFK